MRDVVGGKTHSKHTQGGKDQPNGSLLLLTVDVRRRYEDLDETSITETGDEERQAEQEESQLKTEREQNFHLLFREVVIADEFVAGIGSLVVLGDIDDATMSKRADPQKTTDCGCIARLAVEFVLEGKGYTKVPFYTDSCEEQGAGVDGAEIE